MKKLLTGLACLLLIPALAACGQTASDEPPALQVMLQAETEENKTFEYWAVYADGSTAETEAFTPEDATIYTADYGDFVSDVVDNQVVNTLQATILTDQDGNQIQADDTLAQLMQTAADTIDHDIWQFQIIVTSDQTFAFVKLNVNWQSPCILYQYDATAATLTELCRWDGVDLVGIATDTAE